LLFAFLLSEVSLEMVLFLYVFGFLINIQDFVETEHLMTAREWNGMHFMLKTFHGE